MRRSPVILSFFFFNDTATTEIYTLSLHDALPISASAAQEDPRFAPMRAEQLDELSIEISLLSPMEPIDRKSTRLNSSHQIISYAVFCLKKKKSNRSHPDGVVGLK